MQHIETRTGAGFVRCVFAVVLYGTGLHLHKLGHGFATVVGVTYGQEQELQFARA